MLPRVCGSRLYCEFLWQTAKGQGVKPGVQMVQAAGSVEGLEFQNEGGSSTSEVGESGNRFCCSDRNLVYGVLVRGVLVYIGRTTNDMASRIAAHVGARGERLSFYYAGIRHFVLDQFFRQKHLIGFFF